MQLVEAKAQMQRAHAQWSHAPANLSHAHAPPAPQVRVQLPPHSSSPPPSVSVPRALRAPGSQSEITIPNTADTDTADPIAANPDVADPIADPDVIGDITSDEHTSVDVPWVVLVWNDPINLMSYVVYVFQRLFGYSESKATDLMLDVHNKGRAAVAWGNREKAELDVFRLHEYGLWATMQQDK